MKKYETNLFLIAEDPLSLQHRFGLTAIQHSRLRTSKDNHGQPLRRDLLGPLNANNKNILMTW